MPKSIYNYTLSYLCGEMIGGGRERERERERELQIQLLIGYECMLTHMLIEFCSSRSGGRARRHTSRIDLLLKVFIILSIT